MPLQILIVGLDGLGASLGLALGTLSADAVPGGRPRIAGWDPDARRVSAAKKRLAIDVAEPSLAEAVRRAEVIWVNLPADQIPQRFKEIGAAVAPGTIVTDTAPVKAPVMDWAREYLPATAQFVGGHPFTTVSGGPDSGRLDQLRGIIYTLITPAATSQTAVDVVSDLIAAMGAKPYFMDAAEHDSYAAAVAQLPVVTALALTNVISKQGAWREIQSIAGEVLLSATAPATGEAGEVVAALTANREAVSLWINGMVDSLLDLQAGLADPQRLETLVQDALTAHTQLVEARPNSRPGEDELSQGVREIPSTGITGMFFGRRPPKKKG
ncbi:MAG: prephenate dehydrogenase/arogenate dehydrogenase family protein [Herpetosiphon sp.]